MTTSDNIRAQAEGSRADRKPAVEKPCTQCDPPMAGRELQLLNIDNSDLFHTLRRSLAAKNFSVPDGNRWPAADLNNTTNNLKGIAQLKPDPTEVEPFLPDPGISDWQERTDAYVRLMDDLTADVLDVISAEWLIPSCHQRGKNQWHRRLACASAG